MRIRIKHVLLGVILGVGAWALAPPRIEQRGDTARITSAGAETTATKPAGSSASKPASPGSGTRKVTIRFAPKYFYMPGSIPMGVGEPVQGLTRVAQRYEALHPDVHIEYIAVPSAREWLVTQCAAGLAPDIVDVNVEEVWGDTHKGWYVALDDYLDRPNPYAAPGQPGSTRWSDLIKYPAISESARAPDGRMYCIVYDMVETGIYYNKNIFRKVGVEPPRDWPDFLEIHKKLNAAGYIPMLASASAMADWATDLFFDQLYAGILPGIDVEPEAESLKAFRDGYLNWNEIAFLYKRGFFTRKDPRWVNLWRLIKEWRQFMPKDISDKLTDVIKLFLTQKGAMLWDGSWRVHALIHDPTLEFEWGIFYLPQMPKSVSPYANGHPQVVIGGPGTQFVVTNSAIADTGSTATSERLRHCIDYLQFMTMPENAATVVNEIPAFMPNTKGAEPHEALRPFDNFLKRHSSISKWQFTFDMKFNEVMNRMLELYLNNGISEQDYLELMERSIESGAANLIRRQKPAFAPLEKRWNELAPLRASMEGLPPNAK
ncbi:MAG: ABC transporter substrate-binding protein [Candidatus Sumerlaeaceae bacterium]